MLESSTPICILRSMETKTLQTSDPIEFDVPTWSVYYLTYGEGDTFDDRDKKLADSFEAMLREIASAEGWSDFVLELTGEVNEFNAFPEFGLPCQTEVCKVTFTK